MISKVVIGKVTDRRNRGIYQINVVVTVRGWQKAGSLVALTNDLYSRDSQKHQRFDYTEETTDEQYQIPFCSSYAKGEIYYLAIAHKVHRKAEDSPFYVEFR